MNNLLTISTSIYDRQLNTALFKRLHSTNFGLVRKCSKNILGPCAYNPKTIDEIYREKSCSKYGPYYQKSERFLSTNSHSKSRNRTRMLNNYLSNITDELKRKHEFERRFNFVRLDRQSYDMHGKQKEFVARVPPVTLYEKSSFVDDIQRIYGPYVRLSKIRSTDYPDWYKGPGRSENKSYLHLSIFNNLFSSFNRHKGKFLPKPSNKNINRNKQKLSPGPTTYFSNIKSHGKSSQLNRNKIRPIGFLSSSERFQKLNISNSIVGPATYKPHICLRLCSIEKKKKRNETEKKLKS